MNTFDNDRVFWVADLQYILHANVCQTISLHVNMLILVYHARKLARTSGICDCVASTLPRSQIRSSVALNMHLISHLVKPDIHEAQ